MNQPANFAFWDTVSDFDINDIGYLWCGIEPPSKFQWASLPKMGVIALRTIKAAMKNGELPPAPTQSYPRDTLRTWVESYNLYRPRFLFPPAPARTDLTLETALDLIAILAKAADPRWIPGQAIPHGMGSKLAKVGDSLGLQFHRNTIGKYLKEAGNKNISAH